MKRILVVDDEVQILKALSRVFLETDYEILTAESGLDALKLIETTEIDMIISDMRMPMLDGYKLLSIIKEKYPKIIRIILSGYAEEKAMFRASLHNVAKLYVFKPWSNNELLQNIDKLFIDDTVLNSKSLTDMIDNLECTSTMPLNCEKLISMIQTDDIETLITEIEKDTDISDLLIKVAKTAIYGVMPNTVKQTAIYIGLNNLKCFLHWACVVTAAKQAPAIGDDPELLWNHSYLTNRIFLFLYEALLHKQPLESAMFAGLMHNVGLIILTKSLQKKGSLKKSDLTPDDYSTLENEEYETLHQEMGAHFLDLWDLPFQMYEIALYHHKPLDPNIINHELVSAVHIAQAYAWKALGATKNHTVEAAVFATLGITEEAFEKKLSRYLK